MSAPGLPESITFGDQSLAIIDRNGKAWLTGADLSRALGYKGATSSGSPSLAIAKIYQRRVAEFSDDMTALVLLPTAGGEQHVRIFSPRGCHLIAMFARTARAAAFRRWVLDVLEGLQAPAEVPAEPSMSPAMQQLLRGYMETMLERFCGRSPAEQELQHHRATAAHMKEDLRKARLALEHAEAYAKQLAAPPAAPPSLLPPELAAALHKAAQRTDPPPQADPPSPTVREAMEKIARTLDLPEVRA